MSLFATGEGGKISFRPSRERARREIISHKPRNASPLFPPRVNFSLRLTTGKEGRFRKSGEGKEHFYGLMFFTFGFKRDFGILETEILDQQTEIVPRRYYCDVIIILYAIPLAR